MNNNKTKGIFCIIIAALGFASMAFFVKLSGNLPTMQKAFFRNLIAMFVSFVTLKKSGIKLEVGKENYVPLLLRCIAGTTGVLCNFWALKYLNMGDANILQKLSPFFAIVMSVFILKEKPDKVEIFSVLVALVGAAFVVKPTRGLASLPALVGLIGGFGAGTAYTFVRKMGKNGVKGPVIVFCFSAFSCLVCLPFSIANFAPMTAVQLICLLMAGVCATIGQFFVTAAYTFAPAKDISVYDYTQVLFAALLGFVFLRELPDSFSLIGYVLIIGVGIFKWDVARKKS